MSAKTPETPRPPASSTATSGKRRRLWLALLVAGGLAGGVSLADAASPGARARTSRRAPPTRRPKKISCVPGAPTSRICLKEGYLDACPQHVSACKRHVEAGFSTFRASREHDKAPKVKMLRPEGDRIPQDLQTGKYFAYEAPSRTRPLRGSGSNNIFARTNLTGPLKAMAVAIAKKAHREPTWEDNGAKAKSCHEYAYEQMYDWARFTDAAAVCRDNHACQMDIAMLPTTPGIADRTLRRKDGRPLVDQFILSGSKKVLPKNTMFTIGMMAEKFVLAGAPKTKSSDPHYLEKTPARQALIDALRDGVNTYRLGCGRGGCKATEFKNEWDFHRKLWDRNRDVSMAEFEEYDRRKREFNRLYQEWSAAVKREIEEAKKTPTPRNFQDLPFTWVTDPYQHAVDVTQFHLSVGKNLGKLEGAAGSLMVIPQQTHGALDLDFDDAATLPVAALAAPVPRRARSPRGRRVARSGTKKSKPSASKTGPATGPSHGAPKGCHFWGNKRTKTEFMGYGPHSCRLGEFLRKEWARMAAGQRSCLDPDIDDCDWSPSLFQQRFVEGAPYLGQQKEYETECFDWAPGSFNTTIKDLEVTIEETKKQAVEAMKKLEPYATKKNGSTDSFGKTFKEADSWGDKDWLATGYSGNLGWRVRAKKHDGNRPCQLTGRTDAGFGVDTWILSNKLRIIGSDVAATLNETDESTLEVNGALVVLNKTVYKGGGSTGSLVFEPEPKSKAGQTVPKPKPSWTVMAGPVPITGSAWGEIMYGAGYSVKGTLNAEQCDLDQISFGMQAQTAPFFMVSALGQVGVGISGVASAGVRGMVNLITFSFPIRAGLRTFMKKAGSLKQPNLGFDVGLDMLLATLSGKLMLYIEIMTIEETWELFRWSGLKAEVALMEPLKVELPLASWKK